MYVMNATQTMKTMKTHVGIRGTRGFCEGTGTLAFSAWDRVRLSRCE